MKNNSFKSFKIFLSLLIFLIILSSCSSSHTQSQAESYSSQDSVTSNIADSPKVETYEAIYCGVYGYGNDKTNKDVKNAFKYVFKIDGKDRTFSMDNGEKDTSGEYSYDLQNRLKRGYTYKITVKNHKIIEVEAILSAFEQGDSFKPYITATAGERTITNLISTSLMPVGCALYIYGGGWDWQDVGSSTQSTTIGISNDWVKFFNEQNHTFSYMDSNNKSESYFPHGGWNEYYYAGLDCSGYIGWVIYNVMNEKSGNAGYVMSAGKMAKAFSEKGWGSFSKRVGSTPISSIGDFLPGDIISLSGHVWMCIGTCDDGSLVIAHSTPSPSRTGQEGGGVQLGAVGNSKNCEAYILADKYMKTYFKEWYSRYNTTLKSFSDYTNFKESSSGIFSWNESTLSDPDRIRSMNAQEVLEFIFNNKKAQ